MELKLLPTASLALFVILVCHQSRSAQAGAISNQIKKIRDLPLFASYRYLITGKRPTLGVAASTPSFGTLQCDSSNICTPIRPLKNFPSSHAVVSSRKPSLSILPKVPSLSTLSSTLSKTILSNPLFGYPKGAQPVMTSPLSAMPSSQQSIRVLPKGLPLLGTHKSSASFSAPIYAPLQTSNSYRTPSYSSFDSLPSSYNHLLSSASISGLSASPSFKPQLSSFYEDSFKSLNSGLSPQLSAAYQESLKSMYGGLGNSESVPSSPIFTSAGLSSNAFPSSYDAKLAEFSALYGNQGEDKAPVSPALKFVGQKKNGKKVYLVEMDDSQLPKSKPFRAQRPSFQIPSGPGFSLSPQAFAQALQEQQNRAPPSLQQPGSPSNAEYANALRQAGFTQPELQVVSPQGRPDEQQSGLNAGSLYASQNPTSNPPNYAPQTQQQAPETQAPQQYSSGYQEAPATSQQQQQEQGSPVEQGAPQQPEQGQQQPEKVMFVYVDQEGKTLYTKEANEGDDPYQIAEPAAAPAAHPVAQPPPHHYQHLQQQHHGQQDTQQSAQGYQPSSHSASGASNKEPSAIEQQQQQQYQAQAPQAQNQAEHLTQFLLQSAEQQHKAQAQEEYGPIPPSMSYASKVPAAYTLAQAQAELEARHTFQKQQQQQQEQQQQQQQNENLEAQQQAPGVDMSGLNHMGYSDPNQGQQPAQVYSGGRSLGDNPSMVYSYPAHDSTKYYMVKLRKKQNGNQAPVDSQQIPLTPQPSISAAQVPQPYSNNNPVNIFNPQRDEISTDPNTVYMLSNYKSYMGPPSDADAYNIAGAADIQANGAGYVAPSQESSAPSFSSQIPSFNSDSQAPPALRGPMMTNGWIPTQYTGVSSAIDNSPTSSSSSENNAPPSADSSSSGVESAPETSEQPTVDAPSSSASESRKTNIAPPGAAVLASKFKSGFNVAAVFDHDFKPVYLADKPSAGSQDELNVEQSVISAAGGYGKRLTVPTSDSTGEASTSSFTIVDSNGDNVAEESQTSITQTAVTSPKQATRQFLVPIPGPDGKPKAYVILDSKIKQ